MKRNTLFLSAALLLSATLSLTACGGQLSAKSAAMADYASENQMVVEETAAYAGEALADTTSSTQILPEGRKLIRTVNMNVETNAFDQLLNTLTAQIAELGGYVEQSSISGSSLNYQNEPTPRYASLTIRLPIDRVDGFITTVSENGNVTNKSESTQDVTLQYSDIESRKKSLTVEQDRIWALLEKADTLEAVIALESRLSEIRYELESMESQLRTYDNQVDYSTMYLSINEVKGSAGFTPTEPETFGQRIQNGFTKNLNAVSKGLTSFFIWLITASPYWVPLAAVILIVLLFIRRHKRKQIVTIKTTVSSDAENPSPGEERS